MIIGITGTFGAGKGEVATYLRSYGFVHYSVTSVITDELQKRGMKINRDTMLSCANELRSQQGNDVFVRRLVERMYQEGVTDAVIESIRVPEEASFLQSRVDAHLLAIDADITIRYNRITKRASAKDTVNFSDFEEQEKKEMYGNNPSGTKIGECIKKADYTIINDTSILDLHHTIDEILHKIRGLNSQKQNTYK